MAANWTDFVSGAVLTAAQLNGVLDNFADVAIFNETQAANTKGGTNTAGAWTKRTLNTTVVNNITGCSISSSVVTLPAGTFVVSANAPFFLVDRCKIKLRNTTAGTDAIIGMSSYINGATQAQITTFLSGVVTTTGSTNFELQYYTQTSNANQGLGVETNFTVSEVYATLQITRIA